MPTVLRKYGFEIVIRTHDHGPPHVHAFIGGEEVVINLGDERSDPEIREIRGMSRPNIRRAMDIVLAHHESIIVKWNRIHG
jgi:hypothetical protein